VRVVEIIKQLRLYRRWNTNVTIVEEDASRNVSCVRMWHRVEDRTEVLAGSSESELSC
jgi:hypothetical protein